MFYFPMEDVISLMNDVPPFFLSPSSRHPAAPGTSPGLHQLVEAQVARTPDAIALLADPATQWSYRQLDAHANRLAHRLQQSGVGAQTPVGVCLPRSPQLVVSVLAVLKSGAVYVPLDPEYPVERLRAMLTDAHIPLIIAAPGAAPPLQLAERTQVFCLDEEQHNLCQQSDEPLHVPIHPAMLASIIFTSGSTGRPKGTLNTHQGIGNRLLAAQATTPLGPGDRLLLEVSPSFDIFLWEMLWPLLAGATIVLVRAGGQRESDYLGQVLRQEGISVAHASPSLLRELLLAEARAPEDLRHMYCGGEVLPPDLQALCWQCWPAVQLHNQYGPTECAIHSTSWTCRPEDGQTRVPIGAPIAQVQIHVVDGQGCAVPAGAVGELAIGGVGVGRGYLGRPELTAARYIPDSWSALPGGRLYLTGDQGRQREDGILEFLSRTDEQVKLRGYRVELGEIEAVLRQCHDLRDAVVVLQETTPGEQRLIAYVVPREEPGPTTYDLRDHARRFLPEYMLPNVWVALPALPRSPNGKLDRQALPLPDAERPEVRSLYVAPRTEVERTLARMWQQLLDLQQVGVYDDFFELGGHSLKATRAVADARRTFQVPLALLHFFQDPTIAAIARRIEGARGNA